MPEEPRGALPATKVARIGVLFKSAIRHPRRAALRPPATTPSCNKVPSRLRFQYLQVMYNELRESEKISDFVAGRQPAAACERGLGGDGREGEGGGGGLRQPRGFDVRACNKAVSFIL